MIDWLPAAGWFLFLSLWLGYRIQWRLLEETKKQRDRLVVALDELLGKPIPNRLRRKMGHDFKNARLDGKNKNKKPRGRHQNG